MFAGIAGNALLVAGGANFPDKKPWEGGTKIWYDNVYILPSPTSEWMIAGKLPRSCAYGFSVTTNEGVVCVGGGDATGHFKDVILLSWNSKRLTVKALPDLPRPCAFMSGAATDRFLFVVGGIENPDATHAMNCFWVLDLQKLDSGWIELEPCPGPSRILAVAAAMGTVFYLFSGASLRPGPNGRAVRTYLNDAYAFNSIAHKWTRLANMPRAAVAAPSPAPILGDHQIVVLTGDDGANVHLNGPGHPGFTQTAIAYSADENRWMDAGSVPFSRATVPTALWQNNWVIPSGERIPGVRSPEVWSLGKGRKG